jgi:ABC-type transporter Mla maintaining outer membrane lipid asymmetry permease subunit MlaE
MTKVQSFTSIFLVAIAVIIISSFFSNHFGTIVGYIKFQDFGVNQVSQVLTVLTLVALFFERALEVYVLTFRKLGEQKFEAEVKNLSLVDPQKEKDALEKLNHYRDETRRITLWTALLGGILISIVGFRGLEPFTNLHEINVTNWQSSLFRVLDILLTGAIIAGGSDAIHKILQAFTTFMDTAAATNKAQVVTVQAQANAAQAQAQVATVQAQAAAQVISTGR